MMHPANTLHRLVELIVLNVGLEAGILDTRIFSMFVVHAIVLTFVTTPLTLLFYPSKYHVHTGGAIAKYAPIRTDPEARGVHPSLHERDFKTHFAVVLDKVEQLPGAMTMAQLLNPVSSSGADARDPRSVFASSRSLSSFKRQIPSTPTMIIEALRLIELTTRTSAILESTESDSLLQNDSVLSVFRTFGQLNNLPFSATLSVVPHDEFAAAILRHVSESATEMLILPWLRGTGMTSNAEYVGGTRNPFDGIFQKSTAVVHDSVVYSEFIRHVFLGCPSDVALFVDRRSNLNVGTRTRHLFLPFFGGPDDRLALSFLVQLCLNPDVTATVVRVVKTDTILNLTSNADGERKTGNEVSDDHSSPHDVSVSLSFAV